MSFNDSKRLAVALVTMVLVSVVGAGAAVAQVSSGDSVPLYAGQHAQVGEVHLSDDGTTLTVEYELYPGWVMTEAHLAVEDSETDIPQTRSGNPKVGQFDHVRTYDPPVTGDTFSVALPAGNGDLYVAAHAVVMPADDVAAPYYAAYVVAFDQGVRNDGSAIPAVRSDPDNGLVYETGHSEAYFVSLGFDDLSTPESDAGYVVVAFSAPIVDGPGDDVRIVEDTWGTYPDETADVYVSVDGTNWTFLGAADNQDRVNSYHTESTFDLASVGLSSATYVKVVDTSDRADFGGIPNADGYDLNAVEALHDAVVYGDEETAWAGGDDAVRFVTKGNWATYVAYARD